MIQQNRKLIEELNECLVREQQNAGIIDALNQEIVSLKVA